MGTLPVPGYFSQIIIKVVEYMRGQQGKIAVRLLSETLDIERSALIREKDGRPCVKSNE